jgi:riboflavin synthase
MENMFTGIIQTIGTIKKITDKGAVRDLVIGIDEQYTHGVHIGDSIAVNGTCLTVVSFSSTSFVAQTVEETRATTTLGKMREGTRVNLEKALAAGERMGGHFVQGHVDGIGVITTIDRQSNKISLSVAVHKELVRYMIDKGSVAIDGISLTIQKVEGGSISIAIIPHTFAATTLSERTVGDKVNIEADVLGKYVISYLSKGKGNSGTITSEKLRENGF